MDTNEALEAIEDFELAALEEAKQRVRDKAEQERIETEEFGKAFNAEWRSFWEEAKSQVPELLHPFVHFPDPVKERHNRFRAALGENSLGFKVPLREPVYCMFKKDARGWRVHQWEVFDLKRDWVNEDSGPSIMSDLTRPRKFPGEDLGAALLHAKEMFRETRPAMEEGLAADQAKWAAEVDATKKFQEEHPFNKDAPALASPLVTPAQLAFIKSMEVLLAEAKALEWPY